MLGRADRSPEMVIVRTTVLFLAAFLLCSCQSPEGSSPEGKSWKTGVKEGLRDGTRKVASATVHGARVVRGSVDTAYRGVKNGYGKPDSGAYGPYPRDYATIIQKHMRRFEGVDET